MTVAAEQLPTRGTAALGSRSWLRWGAGVFAGVETLHFTGGVLTNDWEGWGVFLGNLAFVVVTGAVIVGLTYGLLVRWGLKASPRGRNRPALAGFAAGVLSLAAYPVLFMWAPVLIAPAAVLLGRAGVAGADAGQGSRAYATAGVLLGLASLVVFLGLVTYALVTGSFPPPFDG